MGKIEMVLCDRCECEINTVDDVVFGDKIAGSGIRIKFLCMACVDKVQPIPPDIASSCLSGMLSCGAPVAHGLCQKCLNSFADEKRAHASQPKLF